MKKIATLTFGCFMALASQAQTFSDDFESYTLSLLGPQSADWRTWAGAGGGADDAAVVNTDNHTTAGSKSVYFSSTSASGGPQDVVLPFTPSAPLTTGQFNFTTWFKIPAAKTAYFNFQGNATMGNMYTLDCWMDAATSSIVIQNTGTTVATGTIPVGAWFELEIDVNLNTNSWELLINGVSQGMWSNANNQVWGIDYYPADAAASFWIDDVTYTVTPYTLPALNAAGNLITVSNGLVGQTRLPSVKVRNLGTSTITSFDVALDLNGGTPVVMNVTGVSVPSLATYTVNYVTPFTLVSGANVFTAVISNVNGMGPDGDGSDDIITLTVNPVTPAAGKMVAAEEATGTWCQWCPRGAVYMDAMNSKYSGYFAPIAVHNADPMTNTTYDTGIGALIGGYPSALVDRNPEIDPSAIEGELLSEIVLAPSATMMHTDTFDLSTRVLDVRVTTTITQAISGNWKLAFVVTEDSVTGSTGSYAQSNAYAGGGAGPMGGYESLPNPVPASTMVYDHVAREIQPSFAGMSSAFGGSAGVGAIFNHYFSFTVPAGYRHQKMHIITLLIDPSGKVDNAGMSDIDNVVTSGVGIAENVSNATISLFPNPANENVSISVELVKESTVAVEIFSVDGALVAKKEYGTLSGNMILPVTSSNFTSGMYFVNVIVDGQRSVHKLVKQ